MGRWARKVFLRILMNCGWRCYVYFGISAFLVWATFWYVLPVCCCELLDELHASRCCCCIEASVMCSESVQVHSLFLLSVRELYCFSCLNWFLFSVKGSRFTCTEAYWCLSRTGPCAGWVPDPLAMLLARICLFTRITSKLIVTIILKLLLKSDDWDEILRIFLLQVNSVKFESQLNGWLRLGKAVFLNET